MLDASKFRKKVTMFAFATKKCPLFPKTKSDHCFHFPKNKTFLLFSFLCFFNTIFIDMFLCHMGDRDHMDVKHYLPGDIWKLLRVYLKKQNTRLTMTTIYWYREGSIFLWSWLSLVRVSSSISSWDGEAWTHPKDWIGHVFYKKIRKGRNMICWWETRCVTRIAWCFIILDILFQNMCMYFF